MYEWLNKADGTAFVNAHHEDLMLDSKGIYRKTYGALPKVDYKIQANTEGIFAGAMVNGKTIISKLAGDFNFDNLATASAVGLYFDVSLSKIKHAIENYIPSLNRSQIVQKKSTTYWLDCYNANPSSMQLAIES